MLGGGAEGTGADVATPAAPNGSGAASDGATDATGSSDAMGASIGDGLGVVVPVQAPSATTARHASARVSDGAFLGHGDGGGGKPS